MEQDKPIVIFTLPDDKHGKREVKLNKLTPKGWSLVESLWYHNKHEYDGRGDRECKKHSKYWDDQGFREYMNRLNGRTITHP